MEERNLRKVMIGTVIYNKMGAVYTFYQFPTIKSDPFGYTSSAKKKVDSLNS